MGKKGYRKELNTKEWRDKRNSIVERDNGACQFCGSVRGPLNVHHLRYLPNREPYEYAGYDLITVCENCHNTEHHNRAVLKEVRNLTKHNVSNKEIEILIRRIEEVYRRNQYSGMIKKLIALCETELHSNSSANRFDDSIISKLQAMREARRFDG